MTHNEVRQRNVQMREAAKQGATALELAKRFNVSVYTARNECAGLYRPLPKAGIRGPQLTLEQYRERYKDVIELVKKGLTTGQIGRKLRLSTQRICQILHTAQITHPREVRRERNLAIVADRKAGMSFKELGTKYDLEPKTVMTICEAHGMRRPRPFANSIVLTAALLTSEKSVPEIASQYGADRMALCAVAQRLRNAGFGKFIKARDGRKSKKSSTLTA